MYRHTKGKSTGLSLPRFLASLMRVEIMQTLHEWNYNCENIVGYFHAIFGTTNGGV